MAIKLTNNAVSLLAGNITSGATTINLTPGDGSKFPVLGVGDWHPLTLIKASGEREIVKCTARTTDALTIVRAQENTVAAAFLAGDRVELRVTAAAFEAFVLTWLTLTDKPTFASVATSGAYADLFGKPSLAAVATSGAYSSLSGLPTLGALAAKATAVYADIDTAAIGTAANYRANAASVLMTPNAAWEAAVPVVLTYASTVTLDFSTFLNAKLTLTGPVTLTTSNLKPGQSGTIEFVQDATGSRAWSFTATKFAYTGSAPVLPTAANARVVVPYYILSDSRVFLNMSAALVTP